jgi:hypothetical protein
MPFAAGLLIDPLTPLLSDRRRRDLPSERSRYPGVGRLGRLEAGRLARLLDRSITRVQTHLPRNPPKLPSHLIKNHRRVNHVLLGVHHGHHLTVEAQ